MWEEVMELSPGEYVAPPHYDNSAPTHDTYGNDMEQLESPRFVRRYMQGKFLIVAKCSIWNQLGATCDGRHTRMSSQEIREQIQGVMRNRRR